MSSRSPASGSATPHRGEVYLMQSYPTEGSEQAGTRPALVVSRVALNQASPVIDVCPFTDTKRVPRMYPCDVRVRAPEAGLTRDSVVLTGHVRAVAKSRLVRRLGELSAETMHEVEQALKITLDLP